MKVIQTKFPGVVIIEPRIFEDERGFFLETYHRQRYSEAGIDVHFVQDNHSKSKRGIIRGMHFQKTKPQGKLVRCVLGEVYDVVVDINPDSITFGQWEGCIISEQNKKQIWIPPGFAHGFQVLSETADFEYKCSRYYDPGDEACLIWNDATVKIDWPLAEQACLSEKDRTGMRLEELTC